VQRRAAEIKARVAPDVPAGIKAQFRTYQTEGYHFLAYLSANHFGGILADDMGLGKTVQTLAWLLYLRAQPPAQPGSRRAKAPAGAAPALVVCPKSVMDNWHAEAERFAPELRVRLWPASGLPLLRKQLDTADVHVLNYNQLRNLGESLQPVSWLAVILDEGQYIKNPNSQTAQIARALTAENRLVLTGTPIENRLLDLWSLMNFAMPGVLGSRAQFARLYDAKDDPLARKRLSARVRPFLLRRTKSQVATDLPDRIEEDLYCEIEGEQQALYRAELKNAQQRLLRISTQKELAGQQFNFLTSLLRLRQICCHPKLVKPDSQAASAKLEALLEQLEPLMEEGQKVLVFSQFVELLNLVQPELRKRSWRHFYLAGQTENRGDLVKEFQATEGAAVFLISLKAGGFGLNLTAASYVVVFDPWWNPAVENQAIDRTHRIGQVNKVIAYRLLIKNSVEEKIRTLQKTKKALAEEVLGEEKFSQSLTLDDLRFLFAD
jgi:SNF2 family DNA or RNA helicase